MAFSSLKLALAIALVKARSEESESVMHWKKKAKLWKREVEALRHDLQNVQDGMASEILPPAIGCSCFTTKNDGGLVIEPIDTDENDINSLIFRRFLRNVNMWEQSKKHYNSGTVMSSSDRKGQLSSTSRFLVELIGKIKPGFNDMYFATYVHQAIDFMNDALAHMMENDEESKTAADEVIKRLIAQLLGMILAFACGKELQDGIVDNRSWICSILKKMAVTPFVGQRTLLISSEKVVVVAEGLLFMDPFEPGAAQIYDNLYIILQLIEELLSRQSSYWMKDSSFDRDVLEEWAKRYFQMKKSSDVLGRWNSLFSVYMERITCEVLKQIHRISSVEETQGDLQKFFLEISAPCPQ